MFKKKNSKKKMYKMYAWRMRRNPKCINKNYNLINDV